MTDGISIIIPTHNVPDYLYECVTSILSQKTNYDIEILIGVDACENTLNHINDNKEFYIKTKTFYFNENCGPYTIKNNLMSESTYDKIIFFDSDDIMNGDMVDIIYSELNSYDIVRVKFQNFKIVDGNPINGDIETAIGVFGVKKTFFNSVNGFENWKCNADEEFKYRSEFYTSKHKLIDLVCFKRRIHDYNLTIRHNTGMMSELRRSYKKLMNKKTLSRKFTNPEKIKKDYIKIINDEI